jgi:hypothetical protein
MNFLFLVRMASGKPTWQHKSIPDNLNRLLRRSIPLDLLELAHNALYFA